LVHVVHLVREPGRDYRACSFSETFAGIAPSDAPGFIVAQLLGAGAAMVGWLFVDEAARPDRAD
jgi:hypothetical protein